MVQSLEFFVAPDLAIHAAKAAALAKFLPAFAAVGEGIGEGIVR